MSDYISRQAAIEDIRTMIPKDAQLDIKWIEMWLMQLPSAQPEVIRCKDCKWKQGSECVRFADVRPFPDDYCSRAERKEA